MRMDKLTTKFQMALADAQSIAVGGDNQYVEPVHVMMALLNQDGGTARPLLTQAGVNINQLRLKVMEAIDRLPRVEGTPGEVHISRDLNRLLNVTDKLAQQRNDQFISSELFLLAAVDDIIVFHPLERDQIRRIAELQVQIIADRLEREGLGLEMTREAIDFLGNVGYDSVFGARPLKRAIQQRLQNPLAKKLLAGTFKTGDAIVVGLEDGELEFSSKRQEVATES